MTTVQMVASGNEIFQLTTDGIIKRFTGTRDNPHRWTQLDADSHVAEIAAGDNLYKRYRKGRIFAYTFGEWNEISDGPDKQEHVEILAIGPNIYRTSKRDEYVCRYDGSNRLWENFYYGPLQIAAYLDVLNGPHEHKAGYEPVHAELDTNIDPAEIVTGGGGLYVRSVGKQVYQLVGGFWNELASSKAAQITARSAGLYRRDSNRQVWGHIDGEWKLIDRSHENVDIVVGNWLYVRTTDDSIFRYKKDHWEQLQ